MNQCFYNGRLLYDYELSPDEEKELEKITEEINQIL